LKNNVQTLVRVVSPLCRKVTPRIGLHTLKTARVSDVVDYMFRRFKTPKSTKSIVKVVIPRTFRIPGSVKEHGFLVQVQINLSVSAVIVSAGERVDGLFVLPATCGQRNQKCGDKQKLLHSAPILSGATFHTDKIQVSRSWCKTFRQQIAVNISAYPRIIMR